ncbi:MAG: c-type cytochrome [Acidobacteriota bacterium]|nr:c-type cytochrome [Acidobacteriota bacterium]
MVLALVVFTGIGAYVYMRTAMHGFSARAEPSRTETMLATYARATAMPSDARSLKNPVYASSDVLHESMAHFADHCAVCHANNGGGQTMFGNGLYPKPPDLRLPRTQNLTDGEIFYIVENGIRMSGMPAFGGSDSSEDSWKLVYFIRHLPQLTPQEEAQMESLNPKTPEEAQEEKDEEQFLNDGETSGPAPTKKHMKGH